MAESQGGSCAAFKAHFVAVSITVTLESSHENLQDGALWPGRASLAQCKQASLAMYGGRFSKYRSQKKMAPNREGRGTAESQRFKGTTMHFPWTEVTVWRRRTGRQQPLPSFLPSAGWEGHGYLGVYRVTYIWTIFSSRALLCFTFCCSQKNEDHIPSLIKLGTYPHRDKPHPSGLHISHLCFSVTAHLKYSCHHILSVSLTWMVHFRFLTKKNPRQL